MRPDAQHYTNALLAVRATLHSRPAGRTERTGDRGRDRREPGGRLSQQAGTPGGTSAADGAAGAAASAPRASEKPLCEAYDVALLDLDGVVYVGGKAIPGASQALRKASEEGVRLAYVTNNANRTPAAVAEILTGFGVAATAGDVVPPPRPPRGCSRNGDRRGPRPRRRRHGPAGRGARTRAAPSVHRGGKARGHRPGLQPRDQLPDAGRRWPGRRGRALFVGTNADRTLPSATGQQPGNGALLQVITYATGQKPLVAGKPEPPLHEESVARTGARHPLVVGDRLDTDIEAAQRVDADSLLVLTGVTGPAEAVRSRAREAREPRAGPRACPAGPRPSRRSAPGRADSAAAAGPPAGRRAASWTCPVAGEGSTACAPCAPPPGPMTAKPRSPSPAPSKPSEDSAS